MSTIRKRGNVLEIWNKEQHGERPISRDAAKHPLCNGKPLLCEHSFWSFKIIEGKVAEEGVIKCRLKSRDGKLCVSQTA